MIGSALEQDDQRSQGDTDAKLRGTYEWARACHREEALAEARQRIEANNERDSGNGWPSENQLTTEVPKFTFESQ